MAITRNTAIKVRSTTSQDERDGVLFYILPPLLLAAVFAFCAMANDDGAKADKKPAAERSAGK